jgi:hypothetical protein
VIESEPCLLLSALVAPALAISGGACDSCSRNVVHKYTGTRRRHPPSSIELPTTRRPFIGYPEPKQQMYCVTTERAFPSCNTGMAPHSRSNCWRALTYSDSRLHVCYHMAILWSVSRKSFRCDDSNHSYLTLSGGL